MPEDNPQDGVNAVSVASPTPEPQVAAVESPAAENAVQHGPENSGHVPYLRFKEVNDKMRSYEAELAKLRSENKLAKPNEVSSDDNRLEDEEMSKYERRLAEQGLDPKASKTLAKVMKEIAKQEAKERYEKEADKAKEKQAEHSKRLEQSQKEIAEWQSEFRKAHPEDYAKYEEKMQKEWESLDEQGKMALVSSKKSFELLYKAVKADEVEAARAEGEENGRKTAYENQSLKRSISSTPGTTANPGKKYTAEDVGKMSSKEYKANKEQIMKDLGLLK